MNPEAMNFRDRRTSMNSRRSFRISTIALGLLLFSNASLAGETRRLTLAEAVRLRGLSPGAVIAPATAAMVHVSSRRKP